MDTPEVIYLIPDDEYGYTWCDCPAPSDGMEEEDAIKYIRADKVIVIDHGCLDVDEYL